MFLLLINCFLKFSELIQFKKMAGFDDMGIYFADNLGSNEANDEFNSENVHGMKRKFKEFLKEFHDGNFIYKYR